jgi:hypothetical protein
MPPTLPRFHANMFCPISLLNPNVAVVVVRVEYCGIPLISITSSPVAAGQTRMK